MALDDEVEVNWADYIFSRLLESVSRNNTIQTSFTFEDDLMSGLLISYFLEAMMSIKNMGEDLGDFDFIPHRNSKGKTKIAQYRPRNLPKQVKDKGKKPAETEPSAESWTSKRTWMQGGPRKLKQEVSQYQSLPLPLSSPKLMLGRVTKRQETEKIFDELDQLEAVATFQAPKKKMLSSSRSVSLTQTIVHQLRDEPEDTEEPLLQENFDGAKEETRTPEPPLYHKSETCTYPISEHSCQDRQVIIPQAGFPHLDVGIQKIQDWCHPLEDTKATTDLIELARSVTEGTILQPTPVWRISLEMNWKPMMS